MSSMDSHYDAVPMAAAMAVLDSQDNGDDDAQSSGSMPRGGASQRASHTASRSPSSATYDFQSSGFPFSSLLSDQRVLSYSPTGGGKPLVLDDSDSGVASAVQLHHFSTAPTGSPIASSSSPHIPSSAAVARIDHHTKNRALNGSFPMSGEYVEWENQRAEMRAAAAAASAVRETPAAETDRGQSHNTSRASKDTRGGKTSKEKHGENNKRSKRDRKEPKSPRQPPAHYVCHRCNRSGHWIKECPTRDDPAYDTEEAKLLKRKKGEQGRRGNNNKGGTSSDHSQTQSPDRPDQQHTAAAAGGGKGGSGRVRSASHSSSGSNISQHTANSSGKSTVGTGRTPPRPTAAAAAATGATAAATATTTNISAHTNSKVPIMILSRPAPVESSAARGTAVTVTATATATGAGGAAAAAETVSGTPGLSLNAPPDTANGNTAVLGYWLDVLCLIARSHGATPLQPHRLAARFKEQLNASSTLFAEVLAFGVSSGRLQVVSRPGASAASSRRQGGKKNNQDTHEVVVVLDGGVAASATTASVSPSTAATDSTGHTHTDLQQWLDRLCVSMRSHGTPIQRGRLGQMFKELNPPAGLFREVFAYGVKVRRLMVQANPKSTHNGHEYVSLAPDDKKQQPPPPPQQQQPQKQQQPQLTPSHSAPASSPAAQTQSKSHPMLDIRTIEPDDTPNSSRSSNNSARSRAQREESSSHSLQQQQQRSSDKQAPKPAANTLSVVTSSTGGAFGGQSSSTDTTPALSSSAHSPADAPRMNVRGKSPRLGLKPSAQAAIAAAAAAAALAGGNDSNTRRGPNRAHARVHSASGGMLSMLLPRRSSQPAGASVAPPHSAPHSPQSSPPTKSRGLPPLPPPALSTPSTHASGTAGDNAPTVTATAAVRATVTAGTVTDIWSSHELSHLIMPDSRQRVANAVAALSVLRGLSSASAPASSSSPSSSSMGAHEAQLSRCTLLSGAEVTSGAASAFGLLGTATPTTADTRSTETSVSDSGAATATATAAAAEAQSPSVPLFLNTAEPFALLVTGAQGTGKTHTVATIVENCVLHCPPFSCAASAPSAAPDHMHVSNRLSAFRSCTTPTPRIVVSPSPPTVSEEDGAAAAAASPLPPPPAAADPTLMSRSFQPDTAQRTCVLQLHMDDQPLTGAGVSMSLPLPLLVSLTQSRTDALPSLQGHNVVVLVWASQYERQRLRYSSVSQCTVTPLLLAWNDLSLSDVLCLLDVHPHLSGSRSGTGSATKQRFAGDGRAGYTGAGSCWRAALSRQLQLRGDQLDERGGFMMSYHAFLDWVRSALLSSGWQEEQDIRMALEDVASVLRTVITEAYQDSGVTATATATATAAAATAGSHLQHQRVDSHAHTSQSSGSPSTTASRSALSPTISLNDLFACSQPLADHKGHESPPLVSSASSASSAASASASASASDAAAALPLALVVVDLSHPWASQQHCRNVFGMMLTLFLRSVPQARKVLVVDQAEVCLSNPIADAAVAGHLDGTGTGTATDLGSGSAAASNSQQTHGSLLSHRRDHLYDTLLCYARRMHTLNMRMILSTCSPQCIPSALLSSMSAAIVHRTPAPAAWQHLQRGFALSAQDLQRCTALAPEHALVFGTHADGTTPHVSSSSSPPARMRGAAVGSTGNVYTHALNLSKLVHIRQRFTRSSVLSFSSSSGLRQTSASPVV